MFFYTSEKVYDGFTACFRQWRAIETHCKFLHGYSISFTVTFGCTHLDENNWVYDFGGFKRSKTLIDGIKPNEWLSYMFDHTTLIAKDDPEYSTFYDLDLSGAIKLRTVENTGCEKFAALVYQKLNSFLIAETAGRAYVISVKCSEHGKNSATYKPEL
jgi:6-pyruvoyltetrahydropterin/6-carboxytetrahydropterin synthase